VLTTPPNLDSKIAQYATADFDDSALIQEIGLESLSLLRLAVEIADEDVEIDAAGLVDVRTIGDLKVWLTSLLPTTTGEPGAAC
jgi:aryl carrier-like protein